MFWRNEGTFDLFVSPALHGTLLHEIVMDEYVVWAEARARKAGIAQLAPFWAMEYDKVLVRLMRARGFVEQRRHAAGQPALSGESRLQNHA